MDSTYSAHLEEKWNRLATVGKRTPGVTKDFNPLENIPGKKSRVSGDFVWLNQTALSPVEWFDLERFTNAQKLGKKYFLR